MSFGGEPDGRTGVVGGGPVGTGGGLFWDVSCSKARVLDSNLSITPTVIPTTAG